MKDQKDWDISFSPLRFADGAVELIDQRRLPVEELWLRFENAAEVAKAIREMVVRGAPAIGCAAAMGLAAGARSYPSEEQAFAEAFDRDVDVLAASRPTAVNLFWALDQQKQVFAEHRGAGSETITQALYQRARAIIDEDIAACREMGRLGAELIPDGASVLTHCNAGALATGGYGTALGVIRGAVEAGKKIKVYADETRPFLQGSRLTAWELAQSGIDVTLICDNMAGALMAQGAITHCVVGADRIARNGDAANKIGTFSVAVLAQYHGIPFYVAAPRSTIDMAIEDGSKIPIEERPTREVTHVGETQIAPLEVPVRNIAFDVTPAGLIAAIVTESAVVKPNYLESIKKIMSNDQPA